MMRGSVAWKMALSKRTSPWTSETPSSLIVWPVSQAMRSSMSWTVSVSDARYCWTQREIWRST